MHIYEFVQSLGGSSCGEQKGILVSIQLNWSASPDEQPRMIHFPAPKWANRSFITDQSVNVLRPAGTCQTSPSPHWPTEVKWNIENYAGPWWTLQTRMSFWWFSHLEWDGNWCDWLSLTWAIFVHPTYGNIYNLSKRTRANGGVHHIINHLEQRAVLCDGVFGIDTLTPRRTERCALQMTMIQGCFGGLSFVCQFDFDSVLKSIELCLSFCLSPRRQHCISTKSEDSLWQLWQFFKPIE